MKTPLRDGGERVVSETGCLREPPTGRGRFDLMACHALRRLAVHYENGHAKYPDPPRNWENGQPFSWCVNSMFRHLLDFIYGDTSEDHLAAIAWHAFAIMEYQARIELGQLPASLDDMPHTASNSRSLNDNDNASTTMHKRPMEGGDNAEPRRTKRSPKAPRQYRCSLCNQTGH